MTQNTRSLLIRFTGLLAAAMFTLPAFAAQPITTDSRIKTLVYNANEVFTITTHYGYQSNIEFGPKETIETISVGDRVAWQVTPAGRRLFIRAQEENAHTNMTVVTNLHAYQFDLRSSAADAVFGSERLTYVVRFFYPEDAAAMVPPPPPRAAPAPEPMPVPPAAAMPKPEPAPAPQAVLPAPMPAPQAAAMPAPMPTPQAAPMPAPEPAMSSTMPAPAFNYRYTYSGTGPTPVKIFDDGKSTFFKFAGGGNPKVSVITAKGETLAVPSHLTSDGLVAVNVVAQRFSLLQDNEQVMVYNESGEVM